ncbi:MAG TPA: AAA family ATPase [Candidatus Lokiarchaeia archaeon]|nr:AAA family ATPase [Candidatus Lokiarchaeia archaeon]
MISTIDPFQVCIVFCGLPSSGKSTLASHLVQAMLGEDRSHPMQRVDIDVLRTDFYKGEGIDAIFSPEHEASIREGKIKEIVANLEQGKSIIDDDMNYFRSMRKEIADACCKSRVHYAILHVDTPLKKCIEWNHKRGDTIPNEVVEKVANRFDEPESRGYAWDAPFCTVNLAKMSIEQATSDFLQRYTRTSLMFKAKTNLEKLLANAISVLENPAFWNLAKLDAIVNKGYLVNDVAEWKARIDSGSSNAVNSFDLATRRAVNAHVKKAGPISKDLLLVIQNFKKNAIKAIKKDPSRLDALLVEFNTILGTGEDEQGQHGGHE